MEIHNFYTDIDLFHNVSRGPSLYYINKGLKISVFCGLKKSQQKIKN